MTTSCVVVWCSGLDIVLLVCWFVVFLSSSKVFGKKLLWKRLLFAHMEVGCPWHCALVLIMLSGRFMSSLYDPRRAG